MRHIQSGACQRYMERSSGSAPSPAPSGYKPGGSQGALNWDQVNAWSPQQWEQVMSHVHEIPEGDKQFLKANLKFTNEDLGDDLFKAPCNILIAGPSQSGKSCLVKDIIEQKAIDPFPDRIVWAYAEWQPLYDDMIEEGLLARSDFHEGLEGVLDNFENPVSGNGGLLILDDLQHEVASSPLVGKIFLRGSHHRNLSCIFLVQNLYFQGKESRDIALNAHYVVLFKNPSDRLQVSEYARRHGRKKFMERVYDEVCSKPHGFIIIDNTQASDGGIRTGMPVNRIFYPTQGETN